MVDHRHARSANPSRSPEVANPAGPLGRRAGAPETSQRAPFLSGLLPGSDALSVPLRAAELGRPRMFAARSVAARSLCSDGRFSPSHPASVGPSSAGRRAAGVPSRGRGCLSS